MTAPAPPSSRNSQRLLVAVSIALLALMAWRAYSPRFGARPTELVRTAKPVDVNAADRATLLQVPGVGPVMADAILARRLAVGRFETLEELDTVPGIGAKTLDKLRPWLAVGSAVRPLTLQPVEKLERKPASPSSDKRTVGTVNVNTATAEELATLPGIGPKLAERIIAERAKARFVNADDLHRVNGIGPKTIEKLRPLVRFE